MLIFEVGKFYEHTTGKQLAIICEAETTLYGKCLLAEQSDSFEFSAVGKSEDATDNWHEITKEEWMKNFSK